MFQSGVKNPYSTESALLSVLNDIFLATDCGHCVVLVLLNLSAAFDTVDHQIFLSGQEIWARIHGRALERFRSVHVGSAESSPDLSCVEYLNDLFLDLFSFHSTWLLWVPFLALLSIFILMVPRFMSH